LGHLLEDVLGRQKYCVGRILGLPIRVGDSLMAGREMARWGGRHHSERGGAYSLRQLWILI